jgi:hypothetical protein
MTILPSPLSIELIALAMLFYIAGLVTPWYVALERMRGFGRYLVFKLPYAPPPGMTESEALADAKAQGEGGPDDETEQTSKPEE